MDREQLRRPWSAIRELPLPNRQIVVLYLEGMTTAEMGEEVRGGKKFLCLGPWMPGN